MAQRHKTKAQPCYYRGMETPARPARPWVVFAAGAASGALLAALVAWSAWPTTTVLPLRQSDIADEDYTYIDPLLGLQNLNEEAAEEFAWLEGDIAGYIQSEVRAGRADTVSVKVRDLQSSTGFTLNPAERYAPASLLKVPTMMTYFKLAEQTPGLLERRLVYDGARDPLMPYFKPTLQLVAGKSYTTLELIERMIQHSDNDALRVLQKNFNAIGAPNAYKDLARDLGVRDIYVPDDFLTIQGYALFWRVLYNATYLNREHSEQALAILADTAFTQGIKAGVPADVTVAQKFGEYGMLRREDNAIIKGELHDCGIVYLPRHPYLLCVMTKGKNMEALSTIITEISERVYNDRSKHN